MDKVNISASTRQAKLSTLCAVKHYALRALNNVCSGASKEQVPMLITVGVKGQITLPKVVLDAAGLKPGDRVDFRTTASGAIIMEKSDNIATRLSRDVKR